MLKFQNIEKLISLHMHFNTATLQISTSQASKNNIYIVIIPGGDSIIW